jgi:hypothetical protein
MQTLDYWPVCLRSALLLLLCLCLLLLYLLFVLLLVAAHLRNAANIPVRAVSFTYCFY